MFPMLVAKVWCDAVSNVFMSWRLHFQTDVTDSVLECKQEPYPSHRASDNLYVLILDQVLLYDCV